MRLGTRGSKLALAQAEAVRAQLGARDIEVEIVPIKTSGDRGERDRLGAFVREIQEAVLEGTVDVALHCLKDLPTEPVPGVCLSAYLKREDPRDALISRYRGLHELPTGAVVGTGSLRRTSQLAAIRPDLTFRPLVGNVDTRLRRLLDREYDAIVLAMAGLMRLGLHRDWDESAYQTLSVKGLSPFSEMLPAPGQGVLVLESRTDDMATAAHVSELNDPRTQAKAIAERAFLRTFGGGCSVPVGAMASAVGASRLILWGLIASPDGSRVVRGRLEGALEDAESVGRRLGESLGGKGGFEIVDTVLRAREAVA